MIIVYKELLRSALSRPYLHSPPGVFFQRDINDGPIALIYHVAAGQGWISRLLMMCIVLVGLSPVMSAPALGQPPLPDPIFRSGFELPNEAPVADAGNDSSATVGIPVQLDGSGSFDSDGDPLSYAWTVIQRPVNSGAEVFDGDQVDPYLIPDRAGVYVVQLTVFDGELFSDPDTVSITATGALGATALIGSAGGAVGLADGASVLIPPGALSSMVSITIAEIGLPSGSVLPPTGELAGGVYELTPHGQVFQRQVRLVIPYDPDLLPQDYSEGSVAVYRQHQGVPEFFMVGSYDSDGDEPSNSGQILDTNGRLLMARSSTFSNYAAVGLRSSAQFTPVTLSSDNASVVVRQPPNLRNNRPEREECTNANGSHNPNQLPLDSRTANDIAGIVLHSTNGGNVNGKFDGVLGWGTNNCTRFFTHYYIDRDGDIFQVTDDLMTTWHVGEGDFELENDNTIGIELFLNVGEPYDGRQLAALIRLVDYLMDLYALPRPQRDPSTGIVSRNRVDISQGGDRIIAHKDAIPNKCDPSGVFMDYGYIKPEDSLIDCLDPREPSVAARPLSVGSSLAPALMDVVLDAIAVLDRDGQHTGLINTQGGDSFEVAQAGDGGDVTFREDSIEVAAVVGTAERTRWEENEPSLLGPGPLIVPPGATATLTASRVLLGGDIRHYTDVIIAGTLTIDGNLGFALTGTFYLSPTGRIIVRDGRNGGSFGVFSRGVPIVQGLIDARGETGISGQPEGGHGGLVSFTYAAPGLLLVPTLYTRGGDVDIADLTLPNAGPVGGHGGAIMIGADGSHVLLGGGVGPIVGGTRLPTWHAAAIDPALLTEPWAGDYLPPSPPTFLSSLGTILPPIGVRPPLRWGASDVGFARGLVTTGGMGGTGRASVAANQHGGPAGHGGEIEISLGASTLLTFRDIDVVTGTQMEVLTHRFSLPPPAPAVQRLVCPPSGAHGGFGQNFGSRGGDGGAGGDAGALTLTGGVLTPMPVSFVNRQTIRAFPSGQPLSISDDGCWSGDLGIGQVIEARSATAAPLYRLRLNTSRTALLGGRGGIPSGRPTAGYPGDVGPAGASAAITGVPVQ